MKPVDPVFSKLGMRLEPAAITRLMAVALDSPDLLSLAAGFTDNATLPVEVVRETAARLLTGPGSESVLQYGTNRGRTRLRELLAARLAALDGLPAESRSPDEVLVGNGSQQILALATQVLCDPGDIMLVEQPTYFVYLDVLKGLGVDARALPVDETGALDLPGVGALLDDLTREGVRDRIKAVYLVSYYANPSSNTLGESEKTGLANLLAERGLVLPVLEDAAYRELGFGGDAPEKSVLALEAWRDFPKLYAGTLTKTFATGLKVGYGICGHAEWRERILYLKGQHDFGTSNFAQAILEEVLSRGEFEKQLTRLRRAYAEKMETLDRVLRAEGLAEAGWEWARPKGGLFLWLRGPRLLDTRLDSPFFHACLDNKVLYVPGNLCMADGMGKNQVRLSYGVLGLGELEEAGRRFARAAKSFRPS